MAVLIFVANMGGLSGAGTNIPIMLICYDMNMNQAVPLSATVAVFATFFRFFLNFNQKHPNAKDRVAINYEVVEITMPFVFLGSFTGVKLGLFFDEWVRVVVFGLTVAWSIKTTATKAMSLRAKEKAAAEKSALLGNGNQETTTVQLVSVSNDNENDKQEDTFKASGVGQVALELIKYEEGQHFTCRRMFFIIVNLCLLLLNSFVDKNYPGWEGYNLVVKSTVITIFVVSMILLTYYQVRRIDRVHRDKEQYGYEFAPNDLKFDTTGKIIKLSVFCMIAATLCGFTGIAGGMVLGPLFLSYNMVPQVMAGTNQYITMIASIVTAFQFIYIGDLLWAYAAFFGVMTIISAFFGLKALNMYIAKSGK